MSRLLVSAGCQSRLADAWNLFGDAAHSGEAIIIGNTRSAVDDFLRFHCPPEKGVAGIHRLTLGQFASQLASPRLMQESLAPVSRLGREALAARAVFHSRKDLAYFGPVSQMPGFAGGSLACT